MKRAGSPKTAGSQMHGLDIQLSKPVRDVRLFRVFRCFRLGRLRAHHSLGVDVFFRV